MKINPDLKEYIEKNVFPIYENNEKGHGITHIKYVIRRSFELIKENNLNVNYDMVYTIAAYHDIGHHIDAKTHEIISAKIMYDDKNLLRFFSNDKMLTMKEAIEDHRASSNHEPRSIYGKIVSSADRNNTVEQCLRRSYLYGKRHYPNYSDEEIFKNAYNTLNKKFGINGYAKFYFKDSVYENFLTEIRNLLKDKDVFCNAQRNYIEDLKKNNKL